MLPRLVLYVRDIHPHGGHPMVPASPTPLLIISLNHTLLEVTMQYYTENN